MQSNAEPKETCLKIKFIFCTLMLDDFSSAEIVIGYTHTGIINVILLVTEYNLHDLHTFILG